MKGIALIRVSTESQDLKQQRDVVYEEMIKDGYTEENIIPIEDIESGVRLSEEERQGLNKMKFYIETDKEINSVYVYELSRLSRKPDVFYSIRNYLIERKIQLVVIKPSMKLFDSKGNIDQNTMILFGIFSSMSEQEGYIRKERMSRGRKKSVKEGKWVGGKLPFGYKVGDNNHIVINEEEAIIVRKIFKMYSMSDTSMRKLGIELVQTGELTGETYQDVNAKIHRILRNEKYTGIHFGPLNMRYPPIIEKDLFEQIGRLIEERKTQPKSIKKHVSLLQGIIRDGLTKRGLIANSSTAMYQIFLQYPNGESLLSSINLNVTDSVAWYLTMKYKSQISKSNSSKILDDTSNSIKELSKKIEVGKKNLKKLLSREEFIQRRIGYGKVREEIGDKMINEIQRDYLELQMDIEHWEMEKINLISYSQIVEMIDDNSVLENLSSITDPNVKKKYIRETIKSFDIYQIIKRKRYYMCVVTFSNDSTISFVINTYSKVVKYLDGEKMEYEYIRSILRENMKKEHYKRKTDDSTNSRSYNKPQLDRFYP